MAPEKARNSYCARAHGLVCGFVPRVSVNKL